jgi:hypothetical protein
MGAGVDVEFVAAAPNVLHQCVSVHDHSRGVVALEPSHRMESRCESAVVGFDPVMSSARQPRTGVMRDAQEHACVFR